MRLRLVGNLGRHSPPPDGGSPGATAGDDIRDEVLARLLEFNAERPREEARFGAAAAKKSGKRAKRASRPPVTVDLFS